MSNIKKEKKILRLKSIYKAIQQDIDEEMKNKIIINKPKKNIKISYKELFLSFQKFDKILEGRSDADSSLPDIEDKTKDDFELIKVKLYTNYKHKRSKSAYF